METATAVEIDKGRLRQLLLDDFHKLFGKAFAKTAPALPPLPQRRRRPSSLEKAITNKPPNTKFKLLPPLRQLELAGMTEQRELPFPSLEMNRQSYKLFGIVTNMDWKGDRLIAWQHERCGKSEEAHKVMKEDLAGGQLPSGDFGENAAWWWMMVLALNLNVALKQLVLGPRWEQRRMKAIRFALIHLPGRVLNRSRQWIVRLGKSSSAYRLLTGARQKILQLAPSSAGT